MLTLGTSMLEIGMYVAHLDRPWVGTPFLFQRFIIESEEQLQQLQEFCHTVDIDIDKSNPALKKKLLWYKMRFAVPKEEKKASTVDIWRHVMLPREEYDKKQFQADLGVAYQVYDSTVTVLNKVLNDFRLNKAINPIELKACIHGVIDEIVYHPEAMALFTHLKSTQQDTVHHSLNVCVLSVLFGRYLSLHDQQLADLGYAALLHDVGEVKVSQAVLDKHNRGLSAEEKKEMKMHTKYGVDILLKIPDVPEVAIKVARSHHERVDGKGYPDALKGIEIDYFARLVSIVDAYEIVTNYPDTKRHISSTEGLKSIYTMRGSFFDTKLVEDFMRCLGAYPIGSVVKLNNGEIAIVICNRPGKQLLPIVMMVKNNKGILHQPQIINLEYFKDPVGLSKLYITKVIDPDSEGIKLSNYMIKKSVPRSNNI